MSSVSCLDWTFVPLFGLELALNFAGVVSESESHAQILH